MAKKRICTICGKEYEYCGHCPNKNLIEPWRNLYCSENCRKAFQLFGDYKTKKKSAAEIRDTLSLWGLTPEKVREIHKPIVGEIFKEGAPTPIVEEQTKEIGFEKSDEEKSKDRPSFKKKRKFEEKKNDIVNED